MKKITVFIIALCCMSTLQAETKYVSDQMTITLRSGQGVSHKILRSLTSGTPLEIVESTDDGYSLVRTQSGVEGWALTQYLVDEPIARDRLIQAQAQLAKIREENTALTNELDALKETSQRQDKELKRFDSESNKINSEVARLRKVAANPIQLSEENARLKKETIATKNEIRMLQEKNQVLQDGSDKMWFAVGASVLFGGMLLGLIIPKIRWRKKSTWSEL
jgi:SH3 domain protein